MRRLCEPNEKAFPTENIFELRNPKGEVTLVEHHWGGGLTKREYFAAIALEACIVVRKDTPEEYARLALQCADALIDELNKNGRE